MTPSLSPLLVVVVLVLGTLSEAAPRAPPFEDGEGARVWPWLPGYTPSFYSSPSLFPSSGNDPLESYGDYPDSNLRKSMMEDFNRRLLEVQRRCHEDFMVLRRLLEGQDHPMRGPSLDSPFYFPMFSFPYLPGQGTNTEEEEAVEEKDRKKKRKPVQPEEKPEDEGNTDEYPDEYEGGEEDAGTSEGDLESIFLDSPTPGPEWQIIPLLPEVPDADDLPDKYDNSTSTVHVLNGTRVEVNTTTHKDSGDVVTTFYHTEVINILPEESEEEEDTTEGPALEGETEGDEGHAEGPGVAGSDEETRNEDPPLVVPAELKDLFAEMNPGKKARSESNTINDNSIRLARKATESPETPTTAGPQPQHVASYVKAGKDSSAPPRDLSGDTLVNDLSGFKKGGKKPEPDAEVISSEELL